MISKELSVFGKKIYFTVLKTTHGFIPMHRDKPLCFRVHLYPSTIYCLKTPTKFLSIFIGKYHFMVEWETIPLTGPKKERDDEKARKRLKNSYTSGNMYMPEIGVTCLLKK